MAHACANAWLQQLARTKGAVALVGPLDHSDSLLALGNVGYNYRLSGTSRDEPACSCIALFAFAIAGHRSNGSYF